MNGKKEIKDPKFMVLDARNLDHQEEVSGVLYSSHKIHDNYVNSASPTKIRSVSDEIVQNYNLQEQRREELLANFSYNTLGQQHIDQMQSQCKPGLFHRPLFWHPNACAAISNIRNSSLGNIESSPLKKKYNAIKKIKHYDNSKRQDDPYEADDESCNISTNSPIKNKPKKTVTFEL